jgi:hypothetical protein
MYVCTHPFKRLPVVDFGARWYIDVTAIGESSATPSVLQVGPLLDGVLDGVLLDGMLLEYLFTVS